MSKDHGKPPLQFNYYKLTVRNRRTKPTWYITRYQGDSPLPRKMPFLMDSPCKAENFVLNGYDGRKNKGKGRFFLLHVLASSIGDRDHCFTAFLLPPGGSLVFDEFPIESDKDIAQLEFWEASAIRVNGKVDLAEWLPYRVLGSFEIHIPADTETHGKHSAFELKPGKTNQSWPKNKVTRLVPTVLRRVLLKVSSGPRQP